MRIPFLALLAVLATHAGCSSIDRTSAIGSHKLAIGSSLKKDVVNVIGLPLLIEKDATGTRETWYYTGKPISESYFIPLPVSVTPYTPGTQLVHYADVGTKNVIGKDPVILACIFDDDGRLLDVRYPKTKESK